MDQSLQNYEIVTVADRERMLITMDWEELRGGWPARIQSAHLEGGHLVLGCEDANGQAYSLRFLDFPQSETLKLPTYRSSLCGIQDGRVEYAQMFPIPSVPPTLSRGGP